MAQRRATFAQIVGGIVRGGPLAATPATTTFTTARFALSDHFAVGLGIVVMLDRIAVMVRIAFEALILAMLVGMKVVLGILLGAQGSLFRRMLGFFRQQRVAIFLGDLVIIGVDFAER